ncbi:MAG TPA: PilZ domain-containing protein [Candidatus Angelobacter sp.]|nr:PilZ domain-containing protein [Candidatus Angelobacter sp.]
MNQPDQGAQARRWPRYRIDARLKVQTPDEKPAFGRANNLSHGGMGAYIPCAIPVGAEILLEINFTHATADVKVKAVVRNADGYRYGLEFMDLNANLRSIIEKNCAGPAI